MIYDYTSGYPFLVSKICKILDEEFQATTWTKDNVIDAVNLILTEGNSLFDSLLKQMHEYTELKEIIHMLLFTGIAVSFNKDNHVIGLASMFEFIKNADGYIAIANRIFETMLYNFFISEDNAKSDLYKAGVKERKNKRQSTNRYYCQLSRKRIYY